ncbi:reverse transcriptase domain-containing protein [Tanacetum coccineum]
MKQNGVTDDALRLYIFPYSLTHHATAWFDRLPKNSIHTFQEMDSKFLSKYFPPSMVTKLRNDISIFRQLLDESLFEAWERYKFLIDRCPNHNMLPVTQIDTFYNGLTLRHHDTINAAAGGTFMKRRPEECYDLIENMIAHHNDWDTSAHRGWVGYQPQGDRNLLSYRSNNFLGPPGFNPPSNQNQADPSSTPPPFSSSKEVERDPEIITDHVLPKSIVRVPPLVVQPSPSSRPSEIPFLFPTSSSSFELPKRNPHQPQIPYPSRLNKEKLQDNLVEALALMPKYHKMLKDLLSDKEKLLGLANTSLTENCSGVLLKKLLEKLRDPRKFLIPCDFPELEKCMTLADLGASINLMPLFVYKKLMLPELVPTCMTLELANRSIAYPASIAEDVFVQKADLREIEYLLNRDSLIDSSPTTDINIIDPILERFNDEPALVYSSLPGDDDDDYDDLFDLKSDNDEWKNLLYGNFFDNTHLENEKDKDLKIECLIDDMGDEFFPLLPSSDSTLLEESSESSEITTLLSSPFRNEDKVFNPGILILGKTHIFNDESKDKDLNVNTSSEAFLILEE